MYRVPFFCSIHGPEIKINERLTAESGRPISYGVRKRMPHPIPDTRVLRRIRATVLSRKFWSWRNGPPGPFFSENIGPSAKLLVRLAMVNGKPATIVCSGAVVSF